MVKNYQTQVIHYEASLSILDELDSKLDGNQQLSMSDKEKFAKFFDGYRIWLSCFEGNL